MRGSVEAFSNLKVKQEDTLYFIYEEDSDVGALYLGEKLIASGASGSAAVTYLKNLRDVNTTGAIQNSLLGYDETLQSWIAMNPEDVFKVSVMTGANTETDGKSGLVPAPIVGQENAFLRGDGQWVSIDLSGSLSRKIMDTYDAIIEYIENNDDVERYIFMCPAEGAGLTNKYVEYIVVFDENNNRLLEQVGNWDINLDDYVTKKDAQLIQTQVGNLEQLLVNNYATKNEVQLIQANVGSLENSIKNIEDNYVSKVFFNNAVGDLSSLLSQNKTLMKKVEEIESMLYWSELE